MRSDASRRIMLAVFLLSTALLAFEVLAVRLISILFYPIATYLVISLALLGFGFSGALLALRREDFVPSPRLAAQGAAGFSVTLIIALGNVWFASQSGLLTLALFLTLALPFAFGGFSVAVALSLARISINRIYFADLLGAGIGAGLVLLGLSWFNGVQLGAVLSGVGLLSAMLFGGREKQYPLLGLLTAGIIATGLFVRLPFGIVPISPKELALMVAIGDEIRWENQFWNPLARLDVLALPGDSLASIGALEYKLVTQDGGAPTILLHQSPDLRSVETFDQTIFGLPYWIKNEPKVLIIGLGGGPDVQAALSAGAREIIGVEVNSKMIELVRETYAAFTGDPYKDSRVKIVQGDGRHFVQRSHESFDIIQLTGVDTSVASLGANPNLAENYLYTIEAFGEFWDHLNPDGLLSVSFPNVEGLGLRLTAMSSEALNRRGITTPQDHLIVSEITGFVHILLKKSPFTPHEIQEVQDHFIQPVTSLYFPLYHRLFGTPEAKIIAVSGVVASPGLDQSSVYTAFFAAHQTGRATEFLDARAQNVIPPTDNQPFFFVLDKWGASTANFQTLGLTFGLLTIAAIVLMIVPLMIQNRRGLKIHRAAAWASYFLALGLGYIFVEVNLIQKFSLFLGHPSYALAVTLCTMLTSSGLGSLLSGRWQFTASRKIQLVTLGIASLIVLYSIFLDSLFTALLGLPLSFRIPFAVLLASLPAFLMGIPFPTALDRVKQHATPFVPWAWSINGTASVMGTILSVIVALAFGFTAVFTMAAALYLFAGWVFRRTSPAT